MLLFRGRRRLDPGIELGAAWGVVRHLCIVVPYHVSRS
jgi:hypothetical protein